MTDQGIVAICINNQEVVSKIELGNLTVQQLAHLCIELEFVRNNIFKLISSRRKIE